MLAINSKPIEGLATQAGYNAARAALPQILARIGSRMAKIE